MWCIGEFYFIMCVMLDYLCCYGMFVYLLEFG